MSLEVCDVCSVGTWIEGNWLLLCATPLPHRLRISSHRTAASQRHSAPLRYRTAAPLSAPPSAPPLHQV